ncbi:MAG: peptidase, partial [Lachnospiraceae bacterium]|nr:peptidase [Lachnospiraceae bacterium]
MEPYYYLHMNKVHQTAYHAIKTGLLALAPSFPVPRLEGRELADIFFQLRLDCPEIFWATGFRYRFYPDSTNVEFIPEYLFDKAKIKDHQKAMTARVNKLIQSAKSMSEWEKEQYIHDFICENVRYDKLKKPYSHEIIGPLGQGVGVCEGIAKTVKILCDNLGIWCIIAISDADPD